MKVIHLNTHTTGGAAEAALRLHCGLLKKGIQTSFLALYKNKCVINEVYDFRNKLGFFEYWITKIKNKPIVDYYLRKSNKAGELFSPIQTVWKTEENAMINNAEIVHLHWVSNYVNLPEFLSKNYRIVWTLHDYFPFSGGFHYPPPIENIIDKSIIDEQKNTIKKILEKHPITIICPSEHLMNMAKNSRILNSCRFHVIKNGIDHSQFKPMENSGLRKKFNIPDNTKVLLFISDHIHYQRKGFAILEKALLNLKEKTILLVVGKGKVEAKISNTEIRAFGSVSDKQMLVELYNTCDVLINPSVNDISSNTIIEAMACGKPSVAFNTGGIPELINNVNGIIAEEKNAESLSKAIEQALNTHFNSREIVKKSLNEHAIDKIASKYIDVYNTLL